MRLSLDSAAAALAAARVARDAAVQAHQEAKRQEKLAYSDMLTAENALRQAEAEHWLAQNIADHPVPEGAYEVIYFDGKTRRLTVLESRTESGSLRLHHREWTHGRSGVRESRETVRVSPSSVSEYGRWRKNLNLS